MRTLTANIPKCHVAWSPLDPPLQVHTPPAASRKGGIWEAVSTDNTDLGQIADRVCSLSSVSFTVGCQVLQQHHAYLVLQLHKTSSHSLHAAPMLICVFSRMLACKQKAFIAQCIMRQKACEQSMLVFTLAGMEASYRGKLLKIPIVNATIAIKTDLHVLDVAGVQGQVLIIQGANSGHGLQLSILLV